MVYQTNGSLNLGITITRDDIDHHGILNQKWGQRNGPPYPLKPSQHSAAEKAAMKQTKREERYLRKKKRAENWHEIKKALKAAFLLFNDREEGQTIGQNTADIIMAVVDGLGPAAMAYKLSTFYTDEAFRKAHAMVDGLSNTQILAIQEILNSTGNEVKLQNGK